MIGEKKLLTRKDRAIALPVEIGRVVVQQRMDLCCCRGNRGTHGKLPDQSYGVRLRQSPALQLSNDVFNEINHHSALNGQGLVGNRQSDAVRPATSAQ